VVLGCPFGGEKRYPVKRKRILGCREGRKRKRKRKRKRE
jgi:hypothetical protein